MKAKNIVFILFIVSLCFASCRKANPVGSDGCLGRIEKVSETLNAYVENPTVDNCQAYVDALRKYINTGACFGNVFFNEYEKELKELEDDECK
ncbi:MAG: hypothetical protein KDC80_28940 [Saprospiraceae bacterium]|nr:hypothetical protein [Saprospiraceae bacterium]